MKTALLAVLVLASCKVSVVGTGTVVELSDSDWQRWYHELDVRSSFFFCGVRRPGRNCGLEPELLPLASLRSFIIFEEVPSAATCYHRPGKRSLITVPADKWESGCVPHELAHAWLHRIGHPCAEVFEHYHDDDSPVTALECSR